jgi:hypothetical protein
MPEPAGWVYGLANPGPFAIVKGPTVGPEGQWQKSGVDVPSGQTGQTTFNHFPITTAEGVTLGVPADDYLLVRYTSDPAGDIDALYPWLKSVWTIGQGQVIYPEKETAVEKIMDTVGVGDAKSTLEQNVTAFNSAVDEYNTTHATSHPHLDVTGDVSWVDDDVADLPNEFGYKVAYFAAGFGYEPSIFTRDYTAP